MVTGDWTHKHVMLKAMMLKFIIPRLVHAVSGQMKIHHLAWGTSLLEVAGGLSRDGLWEEEVSTEISARLGARREKGFMKHFWILWEQQLHTVLRKELLAPSRSWL